ncbi:unnamed protein product [Closterium sp. NIES-54]
MGKIPLGIRRTPLRIVVTGGAGFVGSHLVDRLMERGDHVIVVDNLFTGRKENVQHHLGNPRFDLIRHDVVEGLLLEVDQIYHLACPASPVHYKHNPIKTIKTNVAGTMNMLGLAKRVGARFLLTSTSEVYGDPLEHPQTEDCYDEGKRVAETLTMDYHRGAGVDVRIARIFNTYGPRMCIDDGRVVSNFVAQALRKEAMTVYGDGKQTRSFQYIDDLVEGLMRLMDGEHVGPFNLGNPGEFTMLELAEYMDDRVGGLMSCGSRELTAGGEGGGRQVSQHSLSGEHGGRSTQAQGGHHTRQGAARVGAQGRPAPGPAPHGGEDTPIEPCPSPPTLLLSETPYPPLASSSPPSPFPSPLSLPPPFQVVREVVDKSASIAFQENTADDPHKRKPDITRAKELLGWEPKVALRQGLPLMVEDFRRRLFGDVKESRQSITAQEEAK